MQMALKMDPGYIDLYAIFVREQENLQKSTTKSHGQTNLLVDVEFSKSYRYVPRFTCLLTSCPTLLKGMLLEQ